MKDKKVLICCFPSDLSGVPQYVRTVSQILVKAGFRVWVLTGSKGAAFSNMGSNVTILEAPNLVNKISIFEVVRFRRAIKSALELSGAGYLYLNGSMFGLSGRIGNFPNIVRIHTYHGLPFDPGVNVVQRVLMYVVEAIMINMAKCKLVVMSRRNLMSIQALKLSGDSQISLIHNTAQDFGSSQPVLKKIDFNNVTLLNVAGFRVQKNHGLLFETFNQLPDRFKLILVGRGTDSPEIRALARRVLTVAKFDRVVFIGESADMITFYNDADLFILTSKYEGLPIAGIEALYHDIPVIMTDVSGAEEICNNMAGLISETMEPLSLRKAVLDICAQLSSGQWKKGAGRSNYDLFFSIGTFEKNILSLFNDR